MIAQDAAVAVLDRPTTQSLLKAYVDVRSLSQKLCQPLETEDYVIQSMADVSPTRWHLAHTTWFFETFVLSRARSNYREYDPHYGYLFNSYYNMVGEQFPRARRGVLSRPTVREVFAYRAHVDKHMRDLLSELDPTSQPKLAEVIEVGLNHEQQHQELILTDIKHVFSCNPLHPVFHARKVTPAAQPARLVWRPYEEGVRWMGHDGKGFSYDNEHPRHRAFVDKFELATRLVTNAEYLAFMEDDGYRRPELWLSEGWATVQERRWEAPLYWRKGDGGWWHFTLSGLRPVDPAEPVCHVSYFEADAYARWSKVWLPTEAAWENAAEAVPVEGNFVDSETFHPVVLDSGSDDTKVNQLFGDVWEWTCSPYVAYPGYRAMDGALGEYNGKFMCNQMVLRGGSCATSRSHVRATYRNFFPPDARWQFTGIRLSRELTGR